MPRWLAVTLFFVLLCAGVLTLGGYAGWEWWRVNRSPDGSLDLPTASSSGPEAVLAADAPKAPSPACTEGRAAFEAKDYETATTRLEVCVEAWPSDNAALMLRGRAYGQLGRWERAQGDLEQALEVDPTDERGWEALAYVRIRSDNDRGAVFALDKWLAQNPNAAVALRMRADAHFRLGERDAALADASQSCALGDADGCTLEGRIKDTRKHR